MEVKHLFAATPVPFGPRGAPSSIAKSAVDRLTVHLDKTEEDEQGNKKLHGGKEKVLHQYALPSYEVFKSHFPDYANAFTPGSIGENISVLDMNDSNVKIGDVYKFGAVILQVGSPRVPCNKISHRYDLPNLDRFVNEHLITGWYYRVLQTGVINIGDAVELEARDSASMSIAEFMQCVNNRRATSRELLEAAMLDGLDPEWKERLQKRAKAVSA